MKRKSEVSGESRVLNFFNIHTIQIEIPFKLTKKKSQKNWTHLQFSKRNTNKTNSSILWYIFFLSLEREFLFEIVRILKKCSIRNSPETSDFLFISPKTTGVNERLIRKFNYTNFHVHIWTVDDGWCPTFWFFKSHEINRYIP